MKAFVQQFISYHNLWPDPIRASLECFPGSAQLSWAQTYNLEALSWKWIQCSHDSLSVCSASQNHSSVGAVDSMECNVQMEAWHRCYPLTSQRLCSAICSISQASPPSLSGTSLQLNAHFPCHITASRGPQCQTTFEQHTKLQQSCTQSSTSCRAEVNSLRGADTLQSKTPPAGFPRKVEVWLKSSFLQVLFADVDFHPWYI